MKSNNYKFKDYLTKFKKMKKAQNILHIIFILMIGFTLVLKHFSFITTKNFSITLVLLFIYGMWLIFLNLYKQNQVFYLLKKIYYDTNNKSNND